MKEYLLLTRLFFRAQYRLDKNKAKGKQRGVGHLILAVFLVLYFWSMMFPVSLFVFGLVDGQTAQALLGTFLVVLLLSCSLLGLRVGYSLFASSHDLPFLLSLPIPSGIVFAAHMTMGYLSELMMVLLLGGPFLVGYLWQHGSVLAVISGLLTLLMTPIFSLAIAALLSLLLVRLTRFFRKGEMLFSVLSTVLAIATVLGLQLGLQRLSLDEGPQLLQNLEQLVESVSRLGRVFPPGLWAAQGIATPFGLGFWLFLLLCGALLALLLWAGGRLYSHGALILMEGKRSKTKGQALRYRQRSVLGTLMLREWRSMFRSPTYAINLFSPLLVAPIMVIAMYSSLHSEGVSLGEVLGNLPLMGFYITFGMVCLICSMNMISSTSMSREGRSIWLLQTIPVCPTYQLAAKFLLAEIASLVEAATITVLMIVFLQIDVATGLWAGLAGYLACVAPLIVSSLPDMLRPRLHWDKEQQAVKNNFNAVIGMFLSMLLLLPQLVVMLLCHRSAALSVGVSLLVSAVEIGVAIALLPRLARTVFGRLAAS